MSNTKKTDFKGKLNKITESRGFWMVLSLIVALMLWTYVTTTEGVEGEKTISGVKIVFQGADVLQNSRGLVVTEQDRTSVNLTVKAARRVLAKLNNTNVTAVINLNTVNTDARYSVSYSISYPSGVSSDEVSVVRASADVINFYVDKLTRKTVPVEGEFVGSTAEGYMTEGELVFNPITVTVAGPKTVVNQVDHAFVTISRTDVDKTLQFTTAYDLMDAEDNVVDDVRITRETEDVDVTLNVLFTKSVPLDVNIIDGGGATRADNTDIRIEPSSIVLAGDAATVEGVNKITLGTVDLSTFSTDFTASYTIVPPNDTANLTGVGEATVNIAITGLSVRSFNIAQNSISCINVPEGYEAEIITAALPVVIRAPEETLNQIQPATALRAVADLADMVSNVTGVLNPTVRIYVDGYPDAGVIGEYRIFVRLLASEE